jgi:hypothetical protein
MMRYIAKDQCWFTLGAGLIIELAPVLIMLNLCTYEECGEEAQEAWEICDDMGY